MKIGIVSSGNDTLALRKILTKYNHDYLIYHNQTFFPFGSKDFTFIIEEIKKAVSFLVTQWAETVILDPVYELALLMKEGWGGSNNMKNKSTPPPPPYEGGYILPLFTTYLHNYAFKYALVGKIWILTDFWSADEIQQIITNLAKNYHPTENQLNTKKFSFPFSYRVKTATARPSGIADLGNHNPYLIRTLKNDLRYFKDANVDTILPMHYQYFKMQRTMKAFFNFRKTRFHDLSVIEKCFTTLICKEQQYSVHIRTNQDPKFLLKEKELVWLLQRGKEVELEMEQI